MLTEFGIAIRKIRLDRGEILKDMADKLHVSSAFLSAVENGRKNIPEKWLDKIIEFYQLDNAEQKSLERAYINTTKSITKINADNMENISSIKKQAAFVFARSFESMPDETAEEILKMLSKRTRDNENERGV